MSDECPVLPVRDIRAASGVRPVLLSGIAGQEDALEQELLFRCRNQQKNNKDTLDQSLAAYTDICGIQEGGH